MEIVYAIFEQLRRFFGMSGLIEIIKSAESQPKEKAVKAKRATKAKK